MFLLLPIIILAYGFGALESRSLHVEFIVTKETNMNYTASCAAASRAYMMWQRDDSCRTHCIKLQFVIKYKLAPKITILVIYSCFASVMDIFWLLLLYYDE